MTYLQAIVLGITQGLTEFLPVSSSGHLIIIPSLFGWETQPLVFDTVLHLGTAGALIVYFFKDLINAFFKEIKIGIMILAGSIPAGIIGLFLDSKIESTFRGVEYVVIFLVLGSLLMYFAENFGSNTSEKQVTLEKSFAIGLFQALALLPGVSRSGSTISGGMILGLNREKAARFSFLLSVPIVVAAGGFKVLSSLDTIHQISLPVLGAGFLSSFLVGIVAIDLLLKFLKSHKLYIFIIYRLFLALFLLFTVL